MKKQIYMDEFDWVSPPDTIVTEAVGSCTGMALFDKVIKQGYLIHLSDPEFGGEMDHFLDLVFQMSDKINLSGKVSGASIFTGDTEEENEHIINIRRYMESLVSEKFVRDQVAIEWPPIDSCTNLEVVTSTGNVNSYPCPGGSVK